jgi:hypothetical protein
MVKWVYMYSGFLLPLPWDMVGERCKNWKCEDGKMGRSGEAVSSPSPLGEGRGEALNSKTQVFFPSEQRYLNIKTKE